MPDSSPSGVQRALRVPRPRRRTAAAVAVALVAGFTLPALAAQPAAARPAIQPLPANLEAIRAQQATQLYGSPEIRPMEQRKTALITMGDSEISGEGVGNYEPGTHQDGNWCDRSLDQAIFRVTIPADVRFNVACSGAQPRHLIAGSGATQHNELNQGDNLAIKARNTKIKLIWVVIGANGTGNIEFAPVVTDCTINRVFFLGACWPDYTDVWATRVETTRQNVETTVNSIKQTMTNAGYDAVDYVLALQSYPGPVSPDVEDNPNFPGWYGGGCLFYLADMAFARNKAVPMFERAIRAAAANTGVRYLDASRLFHGAEVCTESPMVRGLFIEIGIWDENAARQSYHPNYRGHGAFAECMTQFYNSGQQRATCITPASTGRGELRNGLLEFKQLRNIGTNECVDGRGYDSRYNTQQVSYPCHGGRNQGFWYDSTYQSLNTELNQDRCLDITGAAVSANTVKVHNCDALANQRWVLVGDRIHPASNTGLCLGFNNPSSGRPVLRTSACSSSDNRQRWSFEPRGPNPAGYGHDDWIGDAVY
jgi:hypothetical protein